MDYCKIKVCSGNSIIYLSCRKYPLQKMPSHWDLVLIFVHVMPGSKNVRCMIY